MPGSPGYAPVMTRVCLAASRPSPPGLSRQSAHRGRKSLDPNCRIWRHHTACYFLMKIFWYVWFRVFQNIFITWHFWENLEKETRVWLCKTATHNFSSVISKSRPFRSRDWSTNYLLSTLFLLYMKTITACRNSWKGNKTLCSWKYDFSFRNCKFEDWHFIVTFCKNNSKFVDLITLKFVSVCWISRFVPRKQ